MHAVESIRQLRVTTPILVLSVVFVAAGGFIHLTEWLDLYRHIPADSPGADVVRIGFPLNAAASLALATALAVAFRHARWLRQPVIISAVALQVASLAVLVVTRHQTVLGWTERTWTPGAEQSRAVEVAAITSLLVLAVLNRPTPDRSRSVTGSDVGAARDTVIDERTGGPDPRDAVG